MLIANQLDALGFRGIIARSLKPKHVEGLAEDRLQQELSVGTTKNRVTKLLKKEDENWKLMSAEEVAVWAAVLGMDRSDLVVGRTN